MTEHTQTHLNGTARGAGVTPGEKALADWRKAMANEIAALEASDAAPGDADLQRAYRAAVEHSRSIARLAWTMLAEPADVLVRAEIARHCLWPRYHGERRFEAVLMDKEFGDGLELGAFDERAVAELVSAAIWADFDAKARSKPAPRNCRSMLRDSGPNGAAPDRRQAAIWGAILDLRGCRDAIENTVEKMTEKLDRLADETTLTHVIAAGWEPEGEDDDAAIIAQGRATDVATLIQRARAGLMMLRTLWDMNAPRAQMQFAVCSLECLLDDIAELTAPAGAAPPA
jgi:hypothetical protein